MFKSLFVFIALTCLSTATATQVDPLICERWLAAVDGTISLNPNDLALAPPEDMPNRKILFETSFTVGSRTSDEAWTRVIGHVYQWAARIKYLGITERATLRSVLAAGEAPPFRQILMAERTFTLAEASTRRPDGRRRSWALTVEHADQRLSRIRWRVDFGLSLTPNGALQLSTTTSASHPNEFKLRNFVSPRQSPKVIKDILDDPELNAFSGRMPMATRAFVVSALPDFMAAIHDSDRLLPLVYVSRELNSDLPLVDVDALAVSLRGFATVALAPPVAMSGIVPTDALGPLRVYEGDIRVIGPDAENVTKIRPNPGQTMQQNINRIGDLVMRKSMNRVSFDLKGWVGSIFDLI